MILTVSRIKIPTLEQYPTDFELILKTFFNKTQLALLGKQGKPF